MNDFLDPLVTLTNELDNLDRRFGAKQRILQKRFVAARIAILRGVENARTRFLLLQSLLLVCKEKIETW